MTDVVSCIQCHFGLVYTALILCMDHSLSYQEWLSLAGPIPALLPKMPLVHQQDQRLHPGFQDWWMAVGNEVANAASIGSNISDGDRKI